MSSYEYNDLFLKAQVNGIYHMFVFDVVNSKQMSSDERLLAQKQMENLMLSIYSYIKKLNNIQKKIYWFLIKTLVFMVKRVPLKALE